MVREHERGLLERLMMVVGRKIKDMVMECKRMLMDQNMKVDGMKTKNVDGGRKRRSTAKCIRVDFVMAKSMVMQFVHIPTVASMKVGLKRVKHMDMV